jgi:hypothetical protein
MNAFLDVVEHEARARYFSPTRRLQALGKEDRTKTMLPQSEEEIGVNVLRIQSERPFSTRLQDTQLLRLSCADVEDRHNQEPWFDMHDLNSPLVSYSLRKSPGPSGLPYEHWRLLHPKVLQALTTTLSKEFRNPEHSRDMFRIHIKPLPKKAGGPDIRPISLIETTVKVIDKMFLPKLRLWASTLTLVLPEQYGIWTGVSAEDQMIGLVHDVMQIKRASVLISVDLKGAYDRVSSEELLHCLNSKGIPPEWIPYLIHVMLNKHLKVVSQKPSRFTLTTCLRRLSTRPPILLHVLRVVLG